MRREVGGAVCLVLAFLTLLACFGIDAVVIGFIEKTAKGLFGSGVFVLPLSLFISAVILLFHKNRPVRLRVWCAMLLTPLAGAIVHIFADPRGIGWSSGLIKGLFITGRQLQTGGAVSGLAAFTLKYLISSVGAAVVFIAAILLCAFIAVDVSFSSIAQRIKDRPQYPEPEPKKEPQPRVVREKKSRRELTPISAQPEEFIGAVRKAPAKEKPPKPEKHKKVIDIELDDPPVKDIPDIPVDPVPEVQGRPFDLVPDLAANKQTVEKPSQNEAQPVAVPAAQKPDRNEEAEKQRQVNTQVALEIEKEIAQQTIYNYPPVELLNEPVSSVRGGESEMQLTKQRLEEDFRNFNIAASVKGYTRGPAVTRYDVELEKGTKLGSLTRLSDDIALTLGCSGVRIAPIPGKVSMVGIEVPNRNVSSVSIRSVIDSANFRRSSSKVTFAVGEDISGEAVVCDIAKLPHLLIAGTTGSGKSVCMNSIIVSLLYKASPEEVRMIMVDPKMIELGIYNGIPHLLIPVVTDPKKAAGALQWAITEMMKRYRLFSEAGVRDIEAYNDTVSRHPEREKLPHVVIVIDELSDLMMVAAKDVEESICRIAQMARAAGMHLIIATQRPSADVITGLMKANIPSRIAFAVASAMESRIILDTQGAERLVGKGDMLFSPLGAGKPQRVQGCFISSEEVEAVTEFVKNGATADYSEEILSQIEQNAEKNSDKGPRASSEDWDDSEKLDELFSEGVEVILETGQASVSMLQRRLKLGYARAARLVDQMEQHGIVGPFEGSKPRAMLVTREQWAASGQATRRFLDQMDAEAANRGPAQEDAAGEQ